MNLFAWSALLCACSGALVVAGSCCSLRCVALFVYTVSFGAWLLTARPMLLDFMSPPPPILPPPILPPPEVRWLRHVGTQSQTTYTYRNAFPRFRLLPTDGQGAFV